MDASTTLPEPPADPRADWGLPALGSMPQVHHLDEVVTRILAPNPSPMTLDGTNTYVVGDAQSGEALVIDPGPSDADHLRRVEVVLSERELGVRAVLVTHHHVDHAEAAAGWAGRFGCQVVAATAAVAGPEGRTIAEGDHVLAGQVDVEVVATPGHTGDHLAFRLPTGALLTGDHVLGRGTSVVAHPDGDLLAYLASLRRVLDMGPDALYPGHGPELTRDPSAVLRFYSEHREFRRAQIRAALASGPARPELLVARIYADVDRRLWPAAEASTRATLDAMVGRGDVRWGPGDVAILASGPDG